VDYGKNGIRAYDLLVKDDQLALWDVATILREFGVVNVSKGNLILSFMAGLLLFVGMLWYFGFERFLLNLSRVSLTWLIMSIFTFVVVHVFRVLRWRLLLVPVKESLRFSTFFWATAVGFMANILIPVRIGEPLRAGLVSKKERIGFFESLSSVGVERLLDLSCLLLLGMIGLFSFPAHTSLPEWFSNSLRIAGVVTIFIFVVLVLSLKKEKFVLNTLERLLSFVPIIRRFKSRILSAAMSLIRGAKGLDYGLRPLLIIIIQTGCLWLTHFLGFYLIFKAFNLELPAATLLIANILLLLSSALPAPPGYVGTQEAIWLLIFRGLGIKELDLLLTIGVTWHIIGILSTILLGSLGIAWLGLSFKEIFKATQPK